MSDIENNKFDSMLKSLSDKEKELLLKKVSEMDKIDEEPIVESKDKQNLTQEEIDFIFEKLSKELKEAPEAEEDGEYTKGISLSELLGEFYDTGLRKQKDIDIMVKKLSKILKDRKTS